MYLRFHRRWQRGVFELDWAVGEVKEVLPNCEGGSASAPFFRPYGAGPRAEFTYGYAVGFVISLLRGYRNLGTWNLLTANS